MSEYRHKKCGGTLKVFEKSDRVPGRVAKVGMHLTQEDRWETFYRCDKCKLTGLLGT